MDTHTAPASPARRALILLAVAAAAAGPARAALWGDRVEGNRHPSRQARKVGSFHGLALGLAAELELRQGDSESLTLETDDNLQALVETRIEQGTLHIRPARRNLELVPSVLRVVVQVRELDDIAIGGPGSITAAALRARRLHLGLGGSGRIAIDALQAEQVEVAVGGSGSVRLGGTARRMGISVGGSGEVMAEKLQAAAAEVSIGGSGNVKLWATDRLEVAIAGSGRVRYWGDPALESAVVGSGRMVRDGARP